MPAYSDGSTVPVLCADVGGWRERTPDNASPANNETFSTFIADSRVESRLIILADA
jgi:hypothetical protein